MAEPKKKDKEIPSSSSSVFDVLDQQPKAEKSQAPRPSKFQPRVKSKGAPSAPKPKPQPQHHQPEPLKAETKKIKEETADKSEHRNGGIKVEDIVKKEEKVDAHDIMDIDMDGNDVKVEEEKPDIAMDVDEAGGSMAAAAAAAPAPAPGPPPEDRVIREIDVCFRPHIDPDTKVYMVQYPLRPHWRSYGLEERCQEVRVKPKQVRFEVDLAMDENGENYDDNADEYLKISKQTLTSTKAQLAAAYAIGILRGNKLNLTPVQEAVQLRPLMTHIAQGLDDIKRSRKAVNMGDDAEKEKPVEAKPALVSVKPETERQEQLRLRSYQHFKKLEEEEPWIVLEPYGPDNSVTNELLEKLVTVEDCEIPFNMNSHHYIDTLVPGRTSTTSNHQLHGDHTGNAGLSRSYLDSLKLQDRIKAIFSQKRIQVFRFESLMRFASGYSTEEVLNVVKTYAFLVQGCWVPASIFHYRGDLCLVRDYVLLLFSKNKNIHYEQLEELGLPKERVREVLSYIADQKPQEGCWVFREETDKTFIRNNQIIFKEQNEQWLQNEDAIRKAAFSIKQALHGIQASNISSGESLDQLKKSAVNGTGELNKKANTKEKLQLDGSTMSQESRTSLALALREILSSHVCNLKEIRQSLQNLAKVKGTAGNKKEAVKGMAAAKGATAPLGELTSVIDQVASNINGVYFLKSLGNPTIDAYRNVVVKLIRAKGPGAIIRKVEVFEACKLEVGDPSPQIYSKIMKELCTSKGGGWVLKTGDGTD